jgi:Protein of unknown function (DUF4232)
LTARPGGVSRPTHRPPVPKDLGVEPTRLSTFARSGRPSAAALIPTLVTALAAAAALSGCAGTAPTPTTTTPESSAAAAPDTAAPDTTGPDTAAPKPAPQAGGTRACKAADLTLALAGDDGGSGMMKTGYNLRFTNRSQSDCQLWGSPGVSFVTGDDGRQVGEPATRTGRSQGKQVVLRPGATAASPLIITKSDAYPPEKCVPLQVRGLRIYAPGDTASMFVDAPQQACSALGEATMSVGTVD